MSFSRGRLARPPSIACDSLIEARTDFTSAAVSSQFGDAAVKAKALEEAIGAIGGGAAPKVVDGLFADYFKSTAASAKSKSGSEVALSAEAVAELNDELAALAKRDGYEGAVAPMPAKIAV